MSSELMSSELMSSHRQKARHMRPPCIGTCGLKKHCEIVIVEVENAMSIHNDS